MSKQLVHSIYYHPDGENTAFDIEEFFSSRFNVEFQLRELDAVTSKSVAGIGVSILLLTKESYECICCGERSDLKQLFPNPDFTIVLLYFLDKSRHEIIQIMNFQPGLIIQYHSHNQFINLCKDIMAFIVALEGQTYQRTHLQSVRVWPRKGVKANQQLMLVFDKPVPEKSDVTVIQTWNNARKETQPISAMNYSFSIGDAEAGQRNLVIFVNDVMYGKAVLHVVQDEPEMELIVKLLHDIVNPLELLCQVLRIDSSSREDLDRDLIDLIPDNVGPSCIVRYGEHSSMQEIPSLVHFGAKHGLYDFCMHLLKFPGGRQALQIENKNGLLPYQIANQERFKDLAAALQFADETAVKVPVGRESGCDEKQCRTSLVQRRCRTSYDGNHSRYDSKRITADSGISCRPISDRSSSSSGDRISLPLSGNRHHPYETIGENWSSIAS